MTDMNFPQQASAASALIGDPSAFGRVAEDGTVYVRTSQGETALKKHCHTLSASSKFLPQK
jgi:hypothetical protein